MVQYYTRPRHSAICIRGNTDSGLPGPLLRFAERAAVTLSGPRDLATARFYLTPPVVTAPAANLTEQPLWVMSTSCGSDAAYPVSPRQPTFQLLSQLLARGFFVLAEPMGNSLIHETAILRARRTRWNVVGRSRMRTKSGRRAVNCKFASTRCYARATPAPWGTIDPSIRLNRHSALGHLEK
jgi:hypothetical protein